MKVLLTGATGFVGKQIALALVNAGSTVRATTRRKRALTDAVSEIVYTPDLFSEDVAFFECLLEGVDVIVHAAWFVDHGNYISSPENLSSLVGTINFAKAAIKMGTPRFVGVGTCFEYDLSASMPLTSNSPLNPDTAYGAAKVAAFWALSSAFREANISFAWGRLFYLYGEGEDSRRLVPHIRSHLEAGKPVYMSSGNQVRDYLDVAEAGRQIVHLALGNEEGPVNICSGYPQSLKNLARSFAIPLGRENLLRFGAIPDRLGEPNEITGVPYMNYIREIR